MDSTPAGRCEDLHSTATMTSEPDWVCSYDDVDLAAGEAHIHLDLRPEGSVNRGNLALELVTGKNGLSLRLGRHVLESLPQEGCAYSFSIGRISTMDFKLQRSDSPAP